MAGGLFGLGAGTPSRFPYPDRPQPSPGISPSPGIVVRANRVIVFGPTGTPVGVFVYQPGTTPALGNPPIASMTASTVDPFGNAVKPDISVYGTGGSPSFISLLPGNPAIVNIGTGDAVELAPGKVTTSVSGSGGTKLLASLFRAPTVTGQPVATSAFLQLTSPSADLTTTPVALDLVAQTSAANSLSSLQMNPGYTALLCSGFRIVSNGPGGTGAMVIIPPSGDTTGVTDLSVINFALANTFNVQLTTGIYYVNAPIQLPNSAAIFGAGRPPVGKNTGTVIRAVGAISSVMASQSWVLNSAGGNTGCNIANLKIDGNGTAVTCLTLMTFDALCQNVNFENATFQGVELDTHTANGSVGITANTPNNRFIDCTFSNCGQDGIRSDDHGNVVYTDGYMKGCTFATMTGTTSASAAIALDHAGGWIIDGNHFYGLSASCMKLGFMSSTRVVNNYIESWGQGAAAGTFYGIDGVTNPVQGNTGAVVSGNVFWLHTAPGNAGSTIHAVHYFTPLASTNVWVTTGNVFQCDPTVGFVAADAVVYENAGATSVTRFGTGGNEANGGWTATQVQIPAGGTITNTGF